MSIPAPTSIKEHILKFQQTLFGRKKYVKNEYQAYGLELAKELGDWKNRALYIRMAKNMDRKIIERARYFVKDQTHGTIHSPYKLFMWKIKELRAGQK